MEPILPDPTRDSNGSSDYLGGDLLTLPSALRNAAYVSAGGRKYSLFLDESAESLATESLDTESLGETVLHFEKFQTGSPTGGSVSAQNDSRRARPDEETVSNGGRQKGLVSSRQENFLKQHPPLEPSTPFFEQLSRVCAPELSLTEKIRRCRAVEGICQPVIRHQEFFETKSDDKKREEKPRPGLQKNTKTTRNRSDSASVLMRKDTNVSKNDKAEETTPKSANGTCFSKLSYPKSHGQNSQGISLDNLFPLPSFPPQPFAGPDLSRSKNDNLARNIAKLWQQIRCQKNWGSPHRFQRGMPIRSERKRGRFKPFQPKPWIPCGAENKVNNVVEPPQSPWLLDRHNHRHSWHLPWISTWPLRLQHFNVRAWDQIHLMADHLEKQYHAKSRIVSFHGLRSGDGCSTMILFAVRELAERGYRLLLVDASPQTPELTSLLGIAQDPHLYEMVTLIPGRLDLLPWSETPIEIEDGKMCSFESLIASLQSDYDMILLDGGPLLNYSFLECARKWREIRCDGVLLIYKAQNGKTGQLLSDICEKFAEQNIHLLGALENCAS